jgi:hydrogenase maturation protease
LKKTLFLGYGNKDRQDDGVAWHILANLAKRFGVKIPDDADDIDISSGDFRFLFTLQLYPELSEELMKYDKVFFIDAHTGAVKENIHVGILDPRFSNAPLTHHMTPGTLLYLTNTIYHQQPEAVLVSVRGYKFGFETSLSPYTNALVREAVDQIYNLSIKTN